LTRSQISRALGLGALAVTLAACGGGGSTGGGGGGGTPSGGSSPSGPAAAVTIHVVADPSTIGTYKPLTATAKVGDTVAWSFEDTQNSHTVTSDSGAPDSFDSGTVSSPGTYTFTFTKAGTYNYHCNLHSDMKGTITVS
jgi:plastocyanin